MNNLYLVQLQVSGLNITHPVSPIIFNSEHDLESLKKNNPLEYLELLGDFLIAMDVCKNKNKYSMKFIECHFDEKGRGRYFDKVHTANEIGEILKRNVNTLLEISIDSDDLIYLINEPTSITQPHFDALIQLVPNVDKTAIFKDTVDSILNEDVTVKPNAQELAKSVSNKILLNAESRYLSPIYVNENGEMIILGEVAITKKANGTLEVNNQFGEILLENSNALPISFNFAGEQIIKRYFLQNNKAQVDEQKAILNSIYPLHLAKEIVNGLTNIEIEVLIKYWNLDDIDQLVKYVRHIGIQRVYKQIQIKFLYTNLETQHRWVLINLVNNISEYLEQHNDDIDQELLALSRFRN